MEYQQRRKIQAEQTRRDILDAVKDLTKERGFEHVTVRDICQRAGITTGAFYHHFPSKEALLDQGFDSMDAHLERAMSGREDLPPMERLDLLMREYAGFMTELGWETVALYYARRISDPGAASMSPNRYTLRAMLECLTQMRREGALSPGHSPEWVAELFFRHFRGTVIDWVLHRGAYPLWPKFQQDFQLFDQVFHA